MEQGTLTLTRCTVTANAASQTAGPSLAAGIAGVDAVLNPANTTVSGNSSTGSSVGIGAVQMAGSSTTTIVHSTIADNTATSASIAGPFGVFLAGSVTLSSPTIAENGGSVILTATLSHAANADVAVPLRYLGSAARDADYSAPAGVLVIPAGALAAAMTLTSIDDALFDGGEIVRVAITDRLQVVSKGTPATVVSRFLEDEAAPGRPSRRLHRAWPRTAAPS